MTIYVHLLRETSTKLWGLSSRERLRRQLGYEGVDHWAEDLSEIPDDSQVLLLRGDYLYDARIIAALTKGHRLVLTAKDERTPVAAVVQANEAPGLIPLFLNAPGSRPLLPLQRVTPERLCSGFDSKLRKTTPAMLEPIDESRQRALERRLFDVAYKGITDLVTKWLWPVPARWVTSWCVRLGITPNQVTSLSWLLASVALVLFAQGELAWGLLAGWIMTFLDTVDGKLARVTVNYSQFGNLFDHLLDLIHPPLWYLAWGLGLTAVSGSASGLTLDVAIATIFAAYIAGRLAEGAFRRLLGAPFSIFAWRRVDSYSRLITARRNPSLLLLTAAALAGRPDLGLAAVAVWTLASTLFLLARLVMAWRHSRRRGMLRSWLTELPQKRQDLSLASRWFAGLPRGT